ncbi:BZ3500_MvSof-1268-A1-R1_Chr2-2g04769 [Microbotryum saponariae]|uniref:BZ3500_MvSof-1268-A1-R1_Chr2-2g04769 protein n=1 Tax=Microbotryum saponariae TaxID=289078 RepID=A0A2X0KWC7_9BASI|nr:BZ3500_MvSof-1268-A1-R1_Chr2-2g04769 [Microbotryum saponariae]SDA00122.1 BZ3501_MvSof-1269-A2-R1_Chr2-2g04443 [Microbotryum saponariae]
MPTTFTIATKPIGKPTIGVNGFDGDHFGETTLLKAGSTRPGWDGETSAPLTSDILLQHDLPLVMRDGAKLYCDVYKPADAKGPIPCLVMWSPYGKRYSSINMLPVTTWKCGIQSKDLSGWEKFEGLEPARWCPRGYAIASVDTRGAGNSDGFVQIMGQNMGEDGYDVIETLAKMDWCNGNIGMAGNSFLAISQWHIAAQQPPSLKAIAPWEGCGDLFREQFARGGVFEISNMDLINKLIIKGNNGVEDFAEMCKSKFRSDDREPLHSPYWADKRPDMKKIKIPAYISGSDFSSIHTMGSIRGFWDCQGPKWLRWAGRQEWHDLYVIKETNEELMEFFDHYLYGKENNFVKDTPKVRWALLQGGDRDAIENIPIPDFPLPDTEYREFFLAEDGKLASASPEKASTVSYVSRGEGKSVVNFDLKFNEKTQLVGIPKAIVHMSTDDHDDMNVYITLKKLDKDGNQLMHMTIPRERALTSSHAEIAEKDRTSLLLHPGSLGVLRASHRHIDASKNIHPNWPWHPHTFEEKLERGQIVKLEIGIWAMGWQYDAGESLRVEICGGHDMNHEIRHFTTKFPAESTLNKGVHKVHFGGEYASKVILPFVSI